MKIPSLMDGCESRVASWCLTFWKGRFYVAKSISLTVFKDSKPVPTVSLSAIAGAPKVDADSKVSMEFARCCLPLCQLSRSYAGRDGHSTHVETGESRSVGVKGVVVEVDKLLFQGRRSVSCGLAGFAIPL